MSKKIMFLDKYGLTQAVLEGRKTMTRRIVPQSAIEKYSLMEDFTIIDDARYDVGEVVAIAQSYKDAGYSGKEVFAGWPFSRAGWNNKLFVRSDLMPHHIRITGIKIERLQNISEDECIKEGIRKWTKDEELFKYDLADGFEIFEWKDKPRNPREAFAALINSISGKGTFSKNPYVFAYKFELVD